ncbi:MAG: hypothetical protein ACYDGN_02825 [Acidimicrobiales bacterium]
MERRRAAGLGAIALGLVCGVIGKLTSSWELAVVASVALIGGGIMVALTYRAESPRSLGGSRLSLIASAASLKMSSAGRSKGVSEETVLMTQYAESFNGELTLCRQLLSGPIPPAELEGARERLGVLIANPRYGTVISRGLVAEQSVREISAGLAERA